MAFDPPYRLDPFQNIVNVGWGGAVLVLVFSWDKSFGTPPTINNPVGAFIAAPFVPSLNGDLTARVGSPFAPDGKHIDSYWCYEPVTHNTSGTESSTFVVIDSARYDIQTSAGVITAYSDALDPSNHLVPFTIDWNSTTLSSGGSGGADVVLGGAASGFASFLRGYMEFVVDRTVGGSASFIEHQISVLASHTVTDTRTVREYKGQSITFFNIGAMRSSQWAKDHPGEPFPITFNFNGEDSRTFYQYALSASTWTGQQHFPVDADNNPTWDGTHLQGFVEYAPAPLAETATPPRTKTLIVDLDSLSVSIS